MLAHPARLDRLLDPSVGSKDEKYRRATPDQEQGSDGSDEPVAGELILRQ
jgi:hypothetical protein